MNYTLMTADRTTHLKVVAVSLIASIVMLVNLGVEHSDRSPCACPQGWQAGDLDQQRDGHYPLN